jgi:hypothetical protein
LYRLDVSFTCGPVFIRLDAFFYMLPCLHSIVLSSLFSQYSVLITFIWAYWPDFFSVSVKTGKLLPDFILIYRKGNKMAGVAYKQDLPPKGGYAPINFKRIPAKQV